MNIRYGNLYLRHVPQNRLKQHIRCHQFPSFGSRRPANENGRTEIALAKFKRKHVKAPVGRSTLLQTVVAKECLRRVASAGAQMGVDGFVHLDDVGNLKQKNLLGKP